MTVADFIKAGLRTITVIATGETPSASESSDGLEILNRMISSWTAEGFLVYETKRESFNLVASQSSYIWGSGANFNSARPHQILAANIEKDDQEYPLHILQNAIEWARVPNKTLTSTLPSKLYTSGTYPNETLFLWPVPNEANSLVVHSLKPLTAFASTSETISWPPGYEEAALYNFAVRLAPEFGKALDPMIAKLADDLKTNIMRKNIKIPKMKSEALGFNGCTYDIQKDQ